MSNDRIRVRITQQFDGDGFRYVVGAIVGVTKATAEKWASEGKAELYDKPVDTPAPAAS